MDKTLVFKNPWSCLIALSQWRMILSSKKLNISDIYVTIDSVLTLETETWKSGFQVRFHDSKQPKSFLWHYAVLTQNAVEASQ